MEQMAEVSRTAQASVCAPAFPPTEDMPELSGKNDGIVLDEEDEEDVVLTLEEPERMAPAQRDQIICQLTQEQLARRKIKASFHHGKFDPLPVLWQYPPGLPLIGLCNLWLVGSPREHVPAFKNVQTGLIKHFDKRGRTLSKMSIIMREVEHFAKLEDVWLDGKWTAADVTKMWSSIWSRIEPFMRTLTPRKNGGVTAEKSRQGQIAWRTVYNKLLRHGRKWCPSKHAEAMTRTNELTGASEDGELGPSEVEHHKV